MLSDTHTNKNKKREIIAKHRLKYDCSAKMSSMKNIFFLCFNEFHLSLIDFFFIGFAIKYDSLFENA